MSDCLQCGIVQKFICFLPVIPGISIVISSYNFWHQYIIPGIGGVILFTCLAFTNVICVGPPANLSNLESKSLGQIICLTWDAPFSLDITGVDPDIWYRVDITVDIDPFNTSSVNIPFTNFSVNIQEFNFTMDDYNDTSTSVIYEFRVTPINGAGTGPQSEPVTGFFSGRELSVWRVVGHIMLL